jgi:hypothetical protein
LLVKRFFFLLNAAFAMAILDLFRNKTQGMQLDSAWRDLDRRRNQRLRKINEI